ncbi:hypothetical protein BFU36_09550 [Sulfolobus sp. A20]|uniref:hypothetical protein n=1 Tax=Sulfolobaceae TaxID=118883 RepID=UPI000845F5AF|nr:hypothetical protein [Sulfolobus sp. B1]AOL16911.1 hypothetical protein BFU36_09550 [Sulfolobus sp. A20]TRM78695.1 hypothetical protein DJ532_00040 [Sulfolobus sp. A20-N-F8]TRM86758.1 hypothetical protein DJ529_10455 [Sulfolobus sp. C3]TRM93483.1 hypothetical protein DJ526_03720 [Sulfolobus sp. A20-N-G8]TRN02612.1 hypothetical protein DJ527_03465 [Sulfolobus sp. F1]
MTMVEALNKIMKNKKKSANLRLSYYPFLLAVKDHVLQEEDMLKRKRELNNFLDKLYGESRRYLLKYAKDKYYCVCGKTFSSAYHFYTHVFTEHKPTILKN